MDMTQKSKSGFQSPDTEMVVSTSGLPMAISIYVYQDTFFDFIVMLFQLAHLENMRFVVGIVQISCLNAEIQLLPV
jgi:ABC-type dipeptide/oligopeptide/nickel transport system permease component